MARTKLHSRMPKLLSRMPARIIKPWRECLTIFIWVGKVFLGHLAYNTQILSLNKHELLKCTHSTFQITNMRINYSLHARCKVSTGCVRLPRITRSSIITQI